MLAFNSFLLRLNRIRKGYRALILNHTSYLFEEKKDVDGLLWKTCFYKSIEEFRKSLRVHSTHLERLSHQIGVDFELLEQERLFISRLTQDFIRFLTDSIAFYQKLMVEVTNASPFIDFY